MWFLVAMGVVGRKWGSALGKALGGFAGKKLGKYTGMGQKEGAKIGEDIGGDAGDLLPFKKGGRVQKNGKIYAHKGEFVLPKGIKPTTHQIKLVRKRGGFKKKHPMK